MFSCMSGVSSAACGDADWSSRCLRIEAIEAEARAPVSPAHRRAWGSAPRGVWEGLGWGAVGGAAVAPGVGRDTLATVEHLDRAGRGARVHLLADQAVRHGVEKAL